MVWQTFLTCMVLWGCCCHSKHLESNRRLMVETKQSNIKDQSTTGFCISSNSACVEENGENLLASYSETNIIGCVERCSQHPLCEVWTWWGDSDRCQIFRSCSSQITNCTDCQTGPRSCGAWNSFVSAVSGGLSTDNDTPNQRTVYMVNQTGVCDFTLAMPRHRWGHVSAFIKDQLILCGGTTDLAGDMDPNNTCDSYSLQSWDWEEVPAMNENRHGAVGIRLFGMLYVMGGWYNEVNITSSVEFYNPPKKSWTVGSPMPEARAEHCAVAYEDAIIVTGGIGEDGEVSDKVFLYNVTSHKWLQMTSMLQGRAGHGCSLNTRLNEIVVTGGIVGTEIVSSTEAFDIKNQTWKRFTDMPLVLAFHRQIELDQPRIMGGLTGLEMETAFITDLTSEGWNQKQFSLPTNLKHHSITKYPKDLVKC